MSAATASEPFTARWHLAVAAGILGWLLEAVDFFILVFLFDAIAAHFGVQKEQVVYTLALTLAMRPIGALLFGAFADRFGLPHDLPIALWMHTVTVHLKVHMGSRFVDVREYPEFASGHIEGATLVPLGTLNQASDSWDRSQPLTLVCRSGRRSEQAREMLVAKGFQSLSVLQGGIEAWSEDGKALIVSAQKPWSMERQVRVAAGSLVLTFLGLGLLASKKFIVGAGLVGAGLLYAGVSDRCMMASVLGRMPWNDLKKSNA